MENLWPQIAYVLAVLILVSVPGATVGWLIIHPLAAFWKRVGPIATYSIVTLASVLVAAVMFAYREVLLGTRKPFSFGLASLGLGLYALAITLEILCRRHLKLRTLIGLPEIGRGSSELLTDGIYGRVRNPRYLSFLLGVTGWSLVVNFSGLYWLLAAFIPVLFLIILLEERELRQRFGDEYLRYRERVPRLIPRLGRSKR